jgi:hypothetical protein
MSQRFNREEQNSIHLVLRSRIICPCAATNDGRAEPSRIPRICIPPPDHGVDQATYCSSRRTTNQQAKHAPKPNPAPMRRRHPPDLPIPAFGRGQNAWILVLWFRRHGFIQSRHLPNVGGGSVGSRITDVGPWLPATATIYRVTVEEQGFNGLALVDGSHCRQPFERLQTYRVTKKLPPREACLEGSC